MWLWCINKPCSKRCFALRVYKDGRPPELWHTCNFRSRVAASDRCWGEFRATALIGRAVWRVPGLRPAMCRDDHGCHKNSLLSWINVPKLAALFRTAAWQLVETENLNPNRGIQYWNITCPLSSPKMFELNTIIHKNFFEIKHWKWMAHLVHGCTITCKCRPCSLKDANVCARNITSKSVFDSELSFAKRHIISPHNIRKP